MYTVKKGTPMTATLLKAAIDYNEKNLPRLKKLDDYYKGEHDILKRNKGNAALKNNLLIVNHAKYITDTNVGYLLGNPVDYNASDPNIDITPLLDAYKAQPINDVDNEIAKGISIFGRQYEYVYADDDGELFSAKIDDRNAIIIYDSTMKHNKMYGIIYEPTYDIKNEKIESWEVTIADSATITEYTLTVNKDVATMVETAPARAHGCGEVPMIEYINNPEKQGDFEQVISLIDAYNLLQSDRINDKEQLVDAILLFYEMDFTQDQAADLKLSRMLTNIPADGKVEYLTKQLNETDTDVLRAVIESDIHKISMTPNMSDENFVGNSSGVAIRYKLLAFEQNIKNKERYMERGLMQRFRIYNNYLALKNKMSKVAVKEIDAIFKRNLPSNDYETSQTIANLDGKVDDETLVGQLSFVRDAKETVEKAAKKAKANAASAYADYATTAAKDANATKTPEPADPTTAKTPEPAKV